MALLRVGTPLPVSTPICVGDAQCRSCREKLAPGQVVEVRIRVDPPISRERSFLLIKALSKLREKIPGAALLFIEVSDDGRVVRVQVSDDPPSFLSWATVAQLVIIIASLIILLLVARATIEAVFRVLPKPPSRRAAEALWIAASVALAGAGVALAGYGVSRAVGAWRRRF